MAETSASARPRRAWRSVLALLIALVLAGCAGRADTSEFSGQRLDPPFAVDGASLVAGTGEPFSLTESTEAPLTLVFFGYTHCPDICGQVMSTIASAMTRLSEEQRGDVEVVFVTTDPARDDEEAVTDYATAFDDDFLGVTGDLDAILEVAQSMAIAVEKGKRLPSGGYDVTHGTQVMAIGPDDQAHVYWSRDVTSAQLAADIQTLLSE